jgi:hypothetical protein
MFLKRITIAFALVLAMLAIDLKAQEPTLCPISFNIVQRSFWIGECEYIAELCYTCGSEIIMPGHEVSVVWFKKVITDPVCENNMSTQEVLDNIYTQIHTMGFLDNVLGCNQSTPPCGTPGLKKLKLKQRTCWQKIMEPDGSIKYIACPTCSNLCIIEYEYCWDSVTQQVIASVINHYFTGNDFCPLGVEPPDPTSTTEPSVCFGLSTECDYLEN